MGKRPKGALKAIGAMLGLVALFATHPLVWAGDCGVEPCPDGAPMAAPSPPPQPQQQQGPQAPVSTSNQRPRASGQSQGAMDTKIPYSVYQEALQAEKRQQTKENPPAVASEPEVIYPEKTVYTTLSATDTNRFVCTTGEIADIIAPDEKGVIKEHGGNEGWVKFQIERDPIMNKLVFASFDTDIFIKCGGETYSVIGRPKEGPAKTFYMVSPSKSRVKEAERMSALDLDKAVAYIAQRVFLDEVPPHWEEIKTAGSRRFKVAGVTAEHVISWKIPGVDVIVKLFTLRATDGGTVRIEESDLLHPGLIANPVGISIRNHNLSGDRPTTPAIIIERLDGRRRDA